jgi:hypothetical protein
VSRFTTFTGSESTSDFAPRESAGQWHRPAERAGANSPVPSGENASSSIRTLGTPARITSMDGPFGSVRDQTGEYTKRGRGAEGIGQAKRSPAPSETDGDLCNDAITGAVSAPERP